MESFRGETQAGGPRSLARLLGLFERIAAAEDGVTLAELAAALKCPKSSLLGLLKPLVGSGHLLHADGRYRLGPALFSLAATILRGRKFPALVRAAMDELWAATQETIILATIDRDAALATYVEAIDSPQSVRYTIPTGATRPLYCSAAGRVMLAFQEPAWQEAFLARTRLAAMTPRSVTDPAELRRMLAEIRRTGISVSFEEAIPGAGGIAAPIFNPDGSVTASLLIGGPADRLRRDEARLREILSRVARRTNAALGHPGP